jgi:hypothetical protein
MEKRLTRVVLILLGLGLLVCIIEFLRELPSLPPTEVQASPRSFSEAAGRLYNFVWMHYWSTFALKYLFTIYSLCFIMLVPVVTIHGVMQNIDLIPQLLVYSATAVGLLIMSFSLIRSGLKASVLSDVLFAYGTTLVNLGAGYTIAGNIGPMSNRRKGASQIEGYRAEISGLNERLFEAKEQLARCQGRLEEIQNQRITAQGRP